jgi:hypothetical protein
VEKGKRGREAKQIKDIHVRLSLPPSLSLSYTLSHTLSHTLKVRAIFARGLWQKRLKYGRGLDWFVLLYVCMCVCVYFVYSPLLLFGSSRPQSMGSINWLGWIPWFLPMIQYTYGILYIVLGTCSLTCIPNVICCIDRSKCPSLEEWISTICTLS